jgi:tRNA-specific 2-thiouridylase
MTSKGPIVVAMSGGVDSSVAALLLQRDGWEPVGLFMSHGETTTSPGSAPKAARANRCCSLTDADDAGAVAARLGIPFYSINYRREFGSIIERFAAEYRRGRTPIPCVLCNRELKFGSLLTFAKGLGIDRIATGHYAKITRDTGYARLLTPRDRAKDQTYFLMGLAPEVVEHIEFPLGELTKPQVRELAREAGLPVAQKPESMEICFVPNGDYRAVLKKRDDGTGFVAGEIVDVLGKVVGAHDGIENFTVGQRHGLGVATGYPAYVRAIDAATHRVIVAPRDAMADKRVWVSDVIWTDPAAAPSNGDPIRVLAQCRYNAEPTAALLWNDDAGVKLEFDDPLFAVAPGQAAVWYADAGADLQMTGGGWIDRAEREFASA